MIRYIQLFFLCILITNGFSQSALFSDAFKNPSSNFPLLCMGEDKTGKNYYAITYAENNSGYTIDCRYLDSTLQENYFKQVIWTKGPNDKITFLHSGFLNNNLIAFFVKLSEKGNSNELIAINFSKEVPQQDVLDKIEIRNLGNTGNYILSISPSGKYVAALREDFIDKNKKESATILRFGADLKKIDEQSLTFAAQSKPNPVNKIFATDKNDVFIIKKDREKTEYKFYVYAFNNELSGWNHKQITLPGKLIADIDGCLNSDQEFVVSGFCNQFDVVDFQGYFYQRYDNSLKPNTRLQKDFSSEFMTPFIGKKAAGKEGAVIDGYIFERLAAGFNQDVFLIAEKEDYIKSESGEKYIYGDMLYLHLDKEGNIISSGALSNKQETENDNGDWSSFNYAITNDTLHFFHNEVNPSSSKSKFGEKTFAGTYHSIVFKGNNSATNDAKEMIHETVNDLAFSPDLVFQTKNNQMLFLLLNKKKSEFAFGLLQL